MKETDRISLVVYDTNVELAFGLTKMTVQNRERAKRYVSSIVAGTCTNLYGGLIKGNIWKNSQCCKFVFVFAF